MKKVLTLFGILIILSSCTDVEGFETDISSLENQVQDLTTSNASLENENEELNEKVTELMDEKAKTEDDFNNYKERMKPYEALEESEAKAREIEADKIAAEEKAAAEKKKAEEEAAKKAEKEAEEEEKAKGYETGITYDQLARTPDDYMGEKIKFNGKVVQVIEGEDEIQLRFAVNDDYDQMIYLAYSPDIVDKRVLEDDTLTIYGYSMGTISYESTMGGNITIPAAFVENIEFK